MIITNNDLKILRYIHRQRSGVSRGKLLKKFNYDTTSIERLDASNYIFHDYDFPCDDDGFPIGSIPDTAIYRLKTAGIAEIEKHQWFDLEYVISHIVIPIVIAIITTLITIFLTHMQ